MTLSFSIVIPTYQRSDLVAALVTSLGQQDKSPSFECIVVVDGSTDGTAERLRGLQVLFPLRVIEQSNKGAAAARNAGVSRALGDTVLMIDDDMVADHRLLAEHARSIADGAEVVLGHLPLYPGAQDTILSRAVGQWAEGRRRRLEATGRFTVHDMLTGQISVNRALFAELGGFDAAFTAGGTFGNEDIDLGIRLLEAKRRIVFNPDAITWQNYSVGPSHYLRQWSDAGRADVAFVRKHATPDAASVFVSNGNATKRARWLYQPLARLGPIGQAIGRMAASLAVRNFSRAGKSAFWRRFYFATRDLLYWQAVERAGGVPKPRAVTVLCYHAIADLAADPVLAPYGVPPALFAAQAASLTRAGYHFVSPVEFARYLESGTGLPAKPLLITFDDCYTDLLSQALAVMQPNGIRSVAFAVSKLVGGRNEWDVVRGRMAMPLLDAPSLHRLREFGIEIGGHSRTHPNLKKIPSDVMREEIAGGRHDLEAMGLGPIRYFAYPYGSLNAEVRKAVRDAGYTAAFTVSAGLVRRGGDIFALPRIEVGRKDRPWRLRWRIWLARYARRNEELQP